MQHRSFIHHLVVPFLIGMLALGGYIVYKNNPEIMNQETYFKKLTNKAEISDVKIVIAKNQPSVFEPIAKKSIGKLSHRLVPADNSKFNGFNLTSETATWSIVNDHFLALGPNQISVISASGETQWTFRPARDDSFIEGKISTLGSCWYVTSRLGKIYAFDFQSGDLVWFRESRNLYLRQSMVSKEFLLTFVEESAGQKWNLEVLNPHTGELLNSLKGLELPLSGAPLFIERALYFATSNGQLHAVNVRSAKEIWSSEGSSSFRSGPAIYGDRIYLTNEDGLLISFDRNNGKKTMELEMGSVIHEPVQIIDGGAIALAIDAKGYIMAADLKSGKRTWRYNLNQPHVQSNFQVYQLSPQSLSQLNFTSQVRGWTAWTSCSSSRLCIFDVKEGRLLHRVDLKKELTGPFEMAPSSDLLFVTIENKDQKEDATVVALEEYVKASPRAAQTVKAAETPTPAKPE